MKGKLINKIKHIKFLIIPLLIMIMLSSVAYAQYVNTLSESNTGSSKVVDEFTQEFIQIELDEKISLAELEKKFPSQMEVTLDDGSVETVPVTWICESDYENEEYDSYVFEVSLSDGYVMSKNCGSSFIQVTLKEYVAPQTLATTAFAVYSADDTSLRFYKRETVPSVGDSIDATDSNGSTKSIKVTAVYTGVESLSASSYNDIPWKGYFTDITSVVVEDVIKPLSSTAFWFYNFRNCNSFELGKLDTSLVIDMNNMFYYAGYNSTTFELDLSNFNTSNVVNMYRMFRYSGYTSTTWNVVGLSNWDVSNVTNMSQLFANTGNKSLTFELDISDWDTSSATNMSSMFFSSGNGTSEYKLDLSKWDTSSVVTMESMFQSCAYKAETFELNLSNWDISSVTSMHEMFREAARNSAKTFSVNLSNWKNTLKATEVDMSYMFYYAGYNSTTFVLTGLNSWNTSSITTMVYLFGHAGHNASTWNIGDLSNWNVSKVTSMAYMFNDTGCNDLTWGVGDLSKWDVSSVTNMNGMFQDAGYGSTIFDLGNLSNWDISSVTSMANMFRNTGPSATTWNIGNISNWNTSKVTTMVLIFNGSGARELNLSGWNTSSASTKKMFDGMNYLEKIIVGSEFSFSGNGSFTSVLPTPNPIYIPYVTGNWVNIETEEVMAAESVPITVSKDTIYVAEKTYTVSYNGNSHNSGSTSDSTHSLYVSKNLNKNGFIKEGYTFTGWNTKSDGSGDFYVDGARVKNLTMTPGGKVTLYAQWTPITYTVEYDGNTNTGGSTASSSHTYDVAKTLTTNGFTKTGYVFNGWNTKADGTGTSYTNEQSVKNLTTTSGATVTLYAQWTINKYYLDINNLVDGEDVLDVSTLNIGSFDLYSYDGVLKFEGIGDHWAEYEYGATYEIKNIKAMTGYTYLGPSSYSGTIGTSDTEIWLEWKTNEYTLTFNGNGGTPSKTSQKIKYKEHCINLATANREGYEFQGWNTKADGTGETITGKTVMGTSDITVYAQWKPNVYINTLAHWLWGFENGEGNNGYHHETDGDIGFNAAFLMREDSFETAYNTSFEMTKDLAITPPNGTYLLNEFGTYKTNEFSTELDWVVYPFGTKFTQKDKLMHFEYDYAPVDYKITYDLDGGTNHNSNPSTYNVLYGVTLQNPTKAGYTFNGWYDSNGNKVTGINEGCKAEFNSTNELFDELAKRATGDIHLTAKWIINSCTATFDANGGTTPSPQTITKNYNEALGTLPTTSRTGYTFNGWYTAKAGGTKISTTTTMLSSNVTYYAQWTANKYALDVNNLVDGEDIGNVLSENIGSFKVYINGVDWWGDCGDYWDEEDYGTPYEVKDIKAMTGYKYVGPSNISGTFDATDNVVWLEWEAIPYTLTFDGNGGTPSEASRSVKYNKTYGTLPSATRVGYTLAGWNTKADGSGTNVTAETKMGASNVTLYAQWKANTLTINYYPNGATKYDDATYGDGKDIIIIEKPELKYRTDSYKYGNDMPETGLINADRYIRTGYTSTNRYLVGSNDSKILLTDDSNVYSTVIELAQAAGVLEDLEKGDVTISIYPQWKENTLTVNYYTNGATDGIGVDGGSISGIGANENVLAGTSIYKYTTVCDDGLLNYNYERTTNIYLTKTGYIATGYWGTTTSGGTLVDAETAFNSSQALAEALGTTLEDGSKTVNVYAQWRPNTLTVDYYPNGATEHYSSKPSDGNNITTIDPDEKYRTEEYKYGEELPTNGLHNASRFHRTGYTSTNKYHVNSKDSLILLLSEDNVYNTVQELAEAAGVLEQLEQGDVTISIYPEWKINGYTNTIGHYATGFKNGEGNNYENTEFSLPQTYFGENYGSSFTMDEMRATTIPNGFHLTDYFGTNSISDEWHHYDMGTVVTQKEESMEFGYYYEPYNYRITYNLDGGVNNSKNPLYYNVLYGVTLENPTKKGYTFQGWYENLLKSYINQSYYWSQDGTEFTFTNTAEDNEFNYFKVQLVDDLATTYYREIAQSSETGIFNQEYSHTYATGNYKIVFGANGLHLDSKAITNTVYLEQGKTYTVSYEVKSISKDEIVVDNVQFLSAEPVTGINEGCNATFANSEELYSELAKRSTGDIALTAKWKVKSYVNSILHYVVGFKNGEGNDGTHFRIGGTSFNQDYNSTYTVDSSKAVEIPNGLHLWEVFGSEDISEDGSWQYYDIGTTVTQKDENMGFQFNYMVNVYNIEYNLDGGTNSSSNPSTYNVLYGVTLENPTKKGYTFEGWYDNNGNKVTGINECCNATFESADDLYKQLESRTTGDITLTARWTPKSLTVTFHDNRYSDSEAMVSQTYVYNTGGLFPDLEDEWVKKGYTLIGWSEDKDATTHDYSRMANVSNDWINDNSPSIDLYAVWEANTYTIKYDANGGVGTMEDTDVTYGVPTAIRENAFTKEGYTFAGWYMYIEKEDSWQYHNEDGTVFSWYKKGEEPEGYELTLRVNGDKTSTLVYADGEVVIFVAQWKKLGGYIDGLNGKDTNTGATPSDPVKTLRQAYENLKGVGGTIYVVNTISISQNITLDKNYYEDADGRVELGKGIEVIIKRYSKPTTVNDGFNVDSNYTYMIRTEATGSLTLEDIVIDGHKNAVETGSENEIAGGVQAQRAIIYNTGIINIHNAKIMNNYNAYEHELGGGIRNHGTITMIGGEITGNYAEEGGGIFNRPDSTVTIKGGSISNNTATYGGGILSVSVLNIEGGNITGNTASKGGGVYNWSSDADNVGELTITGGIISGNIAGYGGGIQNNGTMTMAGGIVSDNTSEYGGGVLNVGSVIMEGGSIVENTAVDNSDTDDTGGYGGGIYNGIDATFTMNSGTISSNSSTYCGGGVWSSGTLIMKSETAKISGNTATLKGGGGIFNTGSFELKDGLITGNTANGSSYGGGGIFNVGSVIIEDGEISNNTGDYGGGILNGVQGYEAALIIAGGSINDNTANTIAGGVWNNGTLIMEDGAIYGNEAPNGGGVGNYHTFTMSGGTVSNNTAVDNSETEATEGFGKGIYQNGIMNLSGNGKVSTSNDVYLNTDKFITITGELNYSDTAALITPSDYTLGRTVVRTAYGDALASDVYKQFELTSNGNSVLRPGDYVDDSAGILDTDVIISGQYTIHFDKNLDDEVQNMPADQTAYWYEKVTISNKIPTSADYEFIDWNESQDGTGISWFDKIGTEIVFNRDSNLTLYAQWRLKFTLSADVYKMLMPDGEAETIIFKRGEQGKLEMITTGYATRIEVEFPTLSQYDSTLNQTHTLEPVYESVTEQYFNIPLYAPNGIYEIKVTTYNDNNTNQDPITVTLKIKVIDGSVLNDYLTILK